MYSSIKSSAAIATDGTIYVGTTAGVMYAMNPNGQLVWYLPTSGSFDISSPAIATDGSLAIGSVSDSKLYYISNLGVLKWTSLAYGPCYSSPSIVAGIDGSIATFDFGYVHYFSKNGTLKWAYDTKVINARSSVLITGTPGSLLVSADYIYALSVAGILVWKSQIRGVLPSTPILASSSVIYVGDKKRLYTIGSIDSTMSPSIMPDKGLQNGAASPKFKGNAQNTVGWKDMIKYIFTCNYRIPLF
jgi:outer membrane protein assembly factor BamB